MVRLPKEKDEKDKQGRAIQWALCDLYGLRMPGMPIGGHEGRRAPLRQQRSHFSYQECRGLGAPRGTFSPEVEKVRRYEPHVHPSN